MEDRNVLVLGEMFTTVELGIGNGRLVLCDYVHIVCFLYPSPRIYGDGSKTKKC